MSSILEEPNHLSAKNTNLKSAFLKRLEVLEDAINGRYCSRD